MSNFTVGEPAILSPETVDVKPDLTIPRSITGVSIRTSQLPNVVVVEAHLAWRDVARTYRLKSLHLRDYSGGLTTSDLRGITTSEIVSACIGTAPFSDELQAKLGRPPKEFFDALERGSDEFWFWIARRAAVAQSFYGTPNREVMECFSASQRTATRWIARARELGLLD